MSTTLYYIVCKCRVWAVLHQMCLGVHFISHLYCLCGSLCSYKSDVKRISKSLYINVRYFFKIWIMNSNVRGMYTNIKYIVKYSTWIFPCRNLNFFCVFVVICLHFLVYLKDSIYSSFVIGKWTSFSFSIHFVFIASVLEHKPRAQAFASPYLFVLYFISNSLFFISQRTISYFLWMI